MKSANIDFKKNSKEVRNAEIIPIAKSKAVFVKNVRNQPGSKYRPGFWKASMFEVETNCGVYISAVGRPNDQNNPTGEFMPWSKAVGKKVKVYTGYSNAPGWLWIHACEADFLYKQSDQDLSL